MNLIMVESNPNLEKAITNPSDDTRAVAMPTSAIEYNRAASVQKKNPIPTSTNLPSAR